MPLGKYHCDYCDKQFQDTPSARKRHLQGLQHQRAKALWYDSFRDPNQIQAEGYGKGVCNRFVRTGFCQYGDSCKYFHPKQSLQNTNTQSIPGNVVKDSMGNSWGNLPPSLKPPPEGGYPPLPFLDWG
ncbi:zinc finger CCCH domain-containing protein 3 isoform X2 [Vitis vinifera]|uniref:zinc finger CCCH domain-containing protein 3 isoform X2 n=1 Tax=Vitis vinifera TaxID=29760 RepID=UPI00054023D7|nr:zinc finger CCCH domain-containing protein 3 isoform X2 [Vitis vinifera]|eukprot:XP_010659729.1 PREDICTED: zinc finger CCCH domain-containing protein 3 isoform X2 [Vitis vinifera]